MTSRPTPDEHPVVHAYLTDLGRALAGADAGEREEVIATVREHIEVALAERGPEPSADDVAAVLAGLGPVERIADGATSSGAPGAGSGGHPAAASANGSGVARAPAGWAAGQAIDPAVRSAQVLVVLAVMSLLLFLLVPILALPVGIAVFVAAIIGLRRRSEAARGMNRIAALVSGVVVLLGAVAVLGLLAFATGATVGGDVEEVTEDVPVEQGEPTEPAEPIEPETDG